MKREENRSYNQHSPSDSLSEFVDSYWEHKNLVDSPNELTIFPDSFFKLIIYLINGKVTAYFLTGLWPKETKIIIPPNTTVYGIKFKILAPEFIFQHEISSLIHSHTELDLDYWNLKDFQFDGFHHIVQQFESILNKIIPDREKIQGKKLQLSQLLYQMDGNISASEVSEQIDWSNSQINRYLNKCLGVSLKTYLNIQKVYSAYIQIREGRFFPDDGFYDQAHFIREIKKHTNQTPTELHKEQDARFIQLKNIKRK